VLRSPTRQDWPARFAVSFDFSGLSLPCFVHCREERFGVDEFLVSGGRTPSELVVSHSL
jgi:hypothetical protein